MNFEWCVNNARDVLNNMTRAMLEGKQCEPKGFLVDEFRLDQFVVN